MQTSNRASSMSHSLFIAASIVIIVAGLKWSGTFLAPILFAFTLTMLVWPILKWFEEKGVPRRLAITLVAATVVLGIASLILVVGVSLQQFSTNIPHYEEQLNKRILPITERLSVSGMDTATLIRNAGVTGATLARAGIAFASGFIANTYSIVTFLLMLLLMIVASDSVVKKYNKMYSEDSAFAANFESWSKGIQLQYRIQAISNLISGVVTSVFFLLLGVDFAILWGVLVFLLSYIPNVGIIIASIPPVILTFILYDWPVALFVIAVIAALNFIMDNVVTPRFMGAELEIPSVFIFLSFIFCSYLFGILGAFLSLPSLLALRQLLARNEQTRFIAQILGSVAEPTSGTDENAP